MSFLAYLLFLRHPNPDLLPGLVTSSWRPHVILVIDRGFHIFIRLRYKNPANVREALSLASATFDSFVAQSGEGQ